MISGGIEVNSFAQISLKKEVKFGDNPLPNLNYLGENEWDIGHSSVHI